MKSITFCMCFCLSAFHLANFSPSWWGLEYTDCILPPYRMIRDLLKKV